MAYNFDDANSQPITGLEITPYTPPPPPQLNEHDGLNHHHQSTPEFLGSGDVNLEVEEEMEEAAGSDKGGVMSPHPLSVVELPPGRQEEAAGVVGEQMRRKGKRILRTTKLVGYTYVSFDYFTINEDSERKGLGMFEDNCPPNHNDEDMSRFSSEERMLPLPAVLKGWKRETRVRTTGIKDKFYTHPLCTRTFRSLVEVVNFIRMSNNLSTPIFGNSAEELRVQVRQNNHKGPSSAQNKKRKNDESGMKSKSSKRRMFPIVFADDEKTEYKRKIEEFLANAHNNLMNMFSSEDSNPEAAQPENQQKNEAEFPVKLEATTITHDQASAAAAKAVIIIQDDEREEPPESWWDEQRK